MNGLGNPGGKSFLPAKKERRGLPFFVEFVKFASGFSVLIAAALLVLHAATAAGG